ncbi:hypothetical protein FA10DRAFT_292052 [Acaromyces ingoldii]|uniref:Uncharacterized protein n=1 Tax=Acaromyces ingoldii TaxID=215250 RepID=A0A316YNF4_9BASI|nr:hypothetical protein FA10DRAFT_292052 [Acaromyces ingoldii]PWN91080.1 hypothetical protein FA10DRAFT_292052 [Acaromyces ingoldii]
MRVSALLFCLGIAAFAMTARVAAVPSRLAAWRVSKSPPRLSDELDNQYIAMEKRMDENLSKSLSDYLSHRPPVKEQKSLALMRRVHRLHEKIGRLSISASPSHNPSPSTSQEPSTSTSQEPSASTSQDVKLKGLKDKLGLREEQLLESLLDKDILALRKCLKDTQTERELGDQCFSSLKAASDHLEKPFRDIVESARKGDFSGPAVQRMMLLVHQYAEKVRDVSGQDIAPVPASPAAWRVSDSSPLFAGELDGQEAALEKRMDHDPRVMLPRYPFKEWNALRVREHIHILHGQLNLMSCSASTSHNTNTSTSHDSSASQHTELVKLKKDLAVLERELRSELEEKNLKPLQECLQGLEKNNNEWCNKRYDESDERNGDVVTIERSLIAVVTLERSLIAVVAVERSLIAVFAMERSLIAVVAVERSLIAVVTVERSVTFGNTADTPLSHTYTQTQTQTQTESRTQTQTLERNELFEDVLCCVPLAVTDIVCKGGQDKLVFAHDPRRSRGARVRHQRPAHQKWRTPPGQECSSAAPGGPTMVNLFDTKMPTPL